MTDEYVKPTAFLGDRTFAVSPVLPSPQTMNIIVIATALAVSPTNASAAPLDTPLDTRILGERWTNSGTVLEEVRSERVFGDSVLELRRRSGLTWEQLASLFQVDRRSVHLWASGRPMSAPNAEHLNRVLAVVRRADRGTPSATKAWLHSPTTGGVLPLDLLREGRFDEILFPETVAVPVRPSSLSEGAMKMRRPTPPEELVGARHERVHIEKGRLISAVPLKVSKPK